MKNLPSHRIILHLKLEANTPLLLDEANAHYIRTVLRSKKGSFIRVCNKNDGEYLATIEDASKKQVMLGILEQIRPPQTLLPLHLALAIIKHERFLDAADMATQLGATHIHPIICQYSNHHEIKYDKILKRVHHAAEQSERFSTPQLEQPITLDDFLPQNPSLIYANERTRHTAQHCQWKIPPIPTVLVGPEGGFSDEELALLESYKEAQAVSLGPTILRTETAASAMLSYIQINRMS